MNLKSSKEGGLWGMGDKRHKNPPTGCLVKQWFYYWFLQTKYLQQNLIHI